MNSYIVILAEFTRYRFRHIFVYYICIIALLHRMEYKKRKISFIDFKVWRCRSSGSSDMRFVIFIYWVTKKVS